MKRAILLADDSRTIQRLVTQTFADANVEIISVSNGDAAIKKFEELRIHLVLADIYLPGRNGYEVCTYVKNHPELSATPVVLLAGAFEAFDEVTASQAGAAAHITKPFEPQALIDLVVSLLLQNAGHTDHDLLGLGDLFQPVGMITIRCEASWSWSGGRLRIDGNVRSWLSPGHFVEELQVKPGRHTVDVTAWWPSRCKALQIEVDPGSKTELALRNLPGCWPFLKFWFPLLLGLMFYREVGTWVLATMGVPVVSWWQATVFGHLLALAWLAVYYFVTSRMLRDYWLWWKVELEETASPQSTP